MKLTKKEQEKVNTLIETFRQLDKDINKTLQTIKELESEKDILLTKLIEVRQEEGKFIKELEKKYGTGTSLNVETMEIEIKET